MSDSMRRFYLYGIGASVVGILSFLGFVYEPPPGPEDEVTAAILMSNMGQFSTAREKLAEVLEDYPEHLEAILLDAHLAERAGEDDVAEGHYRKALSLIEDNDQQAEVHIALSLLELKSSQPKESLQWIRQARPRDPQIQAKLKIAEAATYAALDRREDAVTAYQEALDLVQDTPQLIVSAGLGLQRLGYYQEALQAYSEGLESCDRSAMYQFARLKFFLGDTDRSLSVMQELAELESTYLRRQLRIDEEFREAARGSGIFPEGFPGL